LNGNPYTRNPSSVRGAGETLGSYIERLSELNSKLRWQSDGHIRWYTHKNPYGCWICEALQNCEQSLSELMALERAIRTIPKKYHKELLEYKLVEDDSNSTKSEEL